MSPEIPFSAEKAFSIVLGLECPIHKGGKFQTFERPNDFKKAICLVGKEEIDLESVKLVYELKQPVNERIY